MSKCWACKCSLAFGACGGGPNTSWCENYPQGGCTGGDLGDLNIDNLTPDEIAASTTKFYGTRDRDGNLTLQEPGFLAAAGIRKGDTLIGVNALNYADDKERQDILRCCFTNPRLLIRFRYGGATLTHEQAIDNPAYSPLPPKNE